VNRKGATSPGWGDCNGALSGDNRLVSDLLQIPLLALFSTAAVSDLTPAELRILGYLPTHHSYPQIAVQAHVSPNTVKTQAQAVYRKLGVSSREEAVERARSIGLLRDGERVNGGNGSSPDHGRRGLKAASGV